MVLRKCPICGKCFDHKSHYTRHYEGCSKKMSKNVCDFCSQSFSTKYSLKRHLNSQNTLCYQNRILKQNQQLLEKIVTNQSAFSHHVQPTTINNITNINQNVTINIQFAQPGQERVDHITEERLLNIFDNDFDTVIRELMRLIYFNKNVPENCHWCIIYPKNIYGALQYNPKTALIDRLLTNEIVQKHFQNMLSLIIDKVNAISEKRSELSNLQWKSVNRFYHYIGADETDSRINESIKMMAYNNNTIPLNIWKNMNINGANMTLTGK